MRFAATSAHNRIASYVNLKAPNDIHNVDTVSSAAIRVRNIKREVCYDKTTN